jgi:DNA-binding CsgD family transcriptional regulator/PAS domain-containing protein
MDTDIMQYELTGRQGAIYPVGIQKRPERKPMELIKSENLYQDEFLQSVFDAIPAFVFIVDEDVKLYFWNTRARQLVGHDPAQVYKRRGGEVLHCIYALQAKDGCGTDKYCSECIIRNSVSKSFDDGKTRREFARLQLWSGETITEVYLLVTASPFHYKEKEYALLLIEDVSHLLEASLEKGEPDPVKAEPTVTLTACEREILIWLKQGKSSWAIARILEMNVRTVNYHVYNIIGKLDAMNRTQAVAIAMKMGLIQGDD